MRKGEAATPSALAPAFEAFAAVAGCLAVGCAAAAVVVVDLVIVIVFVVAVVVVVECRNVGNIFSQQTHT